MQNYKVFINNGLIFFRHRHDHSMDESSLSDFQTISTQDILQIVNRIKEDSFEDRLLIEAEDIEKVFKEFSEYFMVIQAAGGIVQNQRSDFLMIHRFEKWDFPKGHVEKGEEVYRGAIREVIEETGLKSVAIIKKLPSTYHIYTFENTRVLKKTHWYLMSTKYDGPLIPQAEEAILAALWVPNYAMDSYMMQSYPALQDLYQLMIK